MSDSVKRPLQSGDRLFLIDGSGFIFRAFHALPPLTRRSDNTPIGAVSGFCNMLFKLTEELKNNDRPTHIAVIFDAGSKTFRNELYTEYKANRPSPPEDLIPQFSLCREATRAFGIPAIELDNYEADDLIATYAQMAVDAGAEVRIYSSDKDLMQLVTDKISLIDPMKNKIIDANAVFEKFGVTPDRVKDVQALAGDSSDNIPGVAGIGVKTAALLIQEFGDLENLLANAHTIKQNKRRESLIACTDKARLSYQLVTLKLDTPYEVSPEEFTFAEPDLTQVTDFLRKMELSTLTKRVIAKLGTPEEIVPTIIPSQEAQGDLFGGLLTPSVKPALIINPEYVCITDVTKLEQYCASLSSNFIVAFDTETTSLDSMVAEIVGISLSHTVGTGVYIPIAHKTDQPQIPLEDVLRILKPILESNHILKIGHNIKYDMAVMKRYGITLTTMDDTMLLSFCLYGGKHRHNLNDLSELYLNHTPIAFDSLTGKGKNKITFDAVSVTDAVQYAAEDADLTLRLWHYFKPQILAQKKTWFYETIERKMPIIVCDMERTGILPDKEALKDLSLRFEKDSSILAEKIFALAGKDFNIASPKQLGEILFDHLGLNSESKKKKTASGQMATGVDILEDLALEGHDIAEKILAWRQLQKLKSTYADALLSHINLTTGRIHGSFHLTGAATGRFSSSDPNLQNIPIRTPEGRLIRKAFIASPDYKIVSADYSQIELRLLAHIADIPLLKQAFADGNDIHTRTASEIFHVPYNDVDSALRRRAKAVNFGIVYGISAFGLARQLKISQSEAKSYMESYFARLPQVKDYMTATIASARDKGYVETLFGRRIHVPDINSKNHASRSFSERAAINAPIQGAAADVIKLAMIDVHRFLHDSYPNAKMLLQVHDELLFEVPTTGTDAFCIAIKKIMENAPCQRFPLSVPPIVETGIGNNWDEAH